MSVLSSLRYGLARMLVKADALRVISPWITATFLEPTFENLTAEGYKKNSVVSACIQAYTFTIAEPPLLVWSAEGERGEKLPNHPLRKLLRRPNVLMGEDELIQYTAAYMALGGNAYWVAPLGRGGQVVELWPYHAGQVRPKPGGPTWITGYEFYNEQGEWVPIDQDKFVVSHFKWPLPDPSQPWVAQPPLRAAARAVDTDSELDRYLFALLKNDAVPRTTVTLGEGTEMAADEKARFRTQWRERFTGSGRGDVAVLDAGMRVDRVALDLQELAFDALRRVPEARIASAFRVPAILAGLNVGLEQATYSNYEQARRAFTQDSLVPLWRALAAEVENSLGPRFGNPIVRHDLAEVASLQEDQGARWERIDRAYGSGYLTLNEARRALGYEDQVGGDVYLFDPNKRLIPVAALGSAGLLDLTPPAPQLPMAAEQQTQEGA